MCGRFTVQLTGGEIHDLYDPMQPALPLDLPPRYNGAPSQEFAACRLDESGRRVIGRLRWGLIPFWAKNTGIGARMINARAETVRDKPAYRAAFRARRCLVPANGWFGWQGARGAKQPWYIAPADGSSLSFAALWERWDRSGDGLETFTIITTEACEGLARCTASRYCLPVTTSEPRNDMMPFLSKNRLTRTYFMPIVLANSTRPICSRGDCRDEQTRTPTDTGPVRHPFW